MKELLSEVLERLPNAKVVGDNHLRVEGWGDDDDLEIIFVPEGFHGVVGGTIEASFSSQNEVEASFPYVGTDADEIVSCINELIA